MSSQISLNWLSSSLPWKSGVPFWSNYPMIHPIDQTSTYGPYYFFLINSSGARYQRVTTFLVSGLYGISFDIDKSVPNSLDSPKSAIFRIPFLFSNRLVSLRSRWMMYFEWAQLIFVVIIKWLLLSLAVRISTWFKLMKSSSCQCSSGQLVCKGRYRSIQIQEKLTIFLSRLPHP